MLQINNVTKSFDKTSVLNNINWTIAPGRIVGLIGKNGAGKSTLLRCIAGVYDIDQGQISFNNQPIDNNPQIKEDIVLLSDYPFELKQSNLQQLSDFYQIFYPHFDKDVYRQLIEIFNFDQLKPLNKTSKGIKRQASLIIALSLKPKLLLMDESYDGLDPYVRLDLTRFLKQHFINENHTILISSHNVYELEHLCDEMVVLENNTIHQQEHDQADNHKYIKVQVGFNYDVTQNQLDYLKPLDIECEGRVYQIIVEDDFDQFKEKIKELHPALIYQLNLPIQELYIKDIEGKAYERTV